MAVPQPVAARPNNGTAIGADAAGPLSALALICVVFTVLGIKLKWFKQRLVFGGASATDDDGIGAPIQIRGYRSLASAEPQIVRAVFRTGRECDDYVEEGTRSAPLPPIRIHRSNSRFVRPQPQPLSQPATADAVAETRTPEEPHASVVHLDGLNDVDSSEQPLSMPASAINPSVDISSPETPETPEALVFTSVEDVRTGSYTLNAAAAAPGRPDTDPPPYEVGTYKQLTHASTPDLSLASNTSTATVVSASTPDLTAPVDKPMPRVHQSFFSFLMKRSSKQNAAASSPVQPSPKIIRVLKSRKAQPQLQPTGQHQAPQASAQSSIDVPAVTETEIAGKHPPAILHSNNPIQNAKSPTAVVKTVRFVTPAVSEDEDDGNVEENPATQPPQPPQPLKRTILNVAAETNARATTAENTPVADDPWAALDRHRQHNDAIERNRLLVAERLPASSASAQPLPPQRRNRTTISVPVTTDSDAVRPMAPKTLREMQREQRERHENARAARRVETQPSDTDV